VFLVAASLEARRQVANQMACGSLTFTTWIGIRKEQGDARSRRLHLVADPDEEYSARDRRVFFKPTPLFVRWMKAHHSGTHIYEVGCGTGNTASMLAKAGMKVTAIDLAPRTESEFDVIKADAAEYAFEKGSVLLFCRSCHNGFVVKTITRGILCGVADIVYVGLTKNLEDDLGSLHDRFTKRRVGMVGHSGECVWELNVKRLRADASMRRRGIPRLSSEVLQ
jgi:SAM-dependent methyltransferase